MRIPEDLWSETIFLFYGRLDSGQTSPVIFSLTETGRKFGITSSGLLKRPGGMMSSNKNNVGLNAQLKRIGERRAALISERMVDIRNYE